MIIKQLLLILLLIVIGKSVEFIVKNQTEMGNVADLYNFPLVKLKEDKQNPLKSNVKTLPSDNKNKEKEISTQVKIINERKNNEKSSNLVKYTNINDIADLYDFYTKNASEIQNEQNLQKLLNISKNNQTESNRRKYSNIKDIAELYFFSLTNGSQIQQNKTKTVNQTQNVQKLVNITQNNHQYKTNLSRFSNIKNIADLYFFASTNRSQIYDNNTKILQRPVKSNEIFSVANGSQIINHKAVTNITNKVNNQTITQLLFQSKIDNSSNLYYFTSSIKMGMYNCSYDNTINITEAIALPNGSYIYKNHTLIPPDLVGYYDYEILFNGTKIPAPLHKRACICRLKQCITLCSDNIPEFYEDVLKDDEDDDFISLFNIKMTLSNKTIVTKNIVADFEHIVLEEFCIPFYTLSPEKDDKLGWTFFENGTLLRHSDNMQLRKNEYCFELYQDEFFNESYYLINPLNCAKMIEDMEPIEKFNYWTQVFSIPFFLITISAYCCLSELRNVHGKCFMNYLICITISYGLLSYINLSQRKFEPLPCLLMGYFNHYMQLSYYNWLGIICYDTWRSLSDINYESSYCKYTIYGYYLPFLMTLLTFIAQNSKLSDYWKPGITRYKCGLEVNKWAASIYLFGPCLIILIFCLITFILTSKLIKTNDREVIKIKEFKHESARSRYTLYLRLFLMMGLSWFLDTISYLFNMFDMRFLSRIIDYINALQGLYIFINFIGRRKVRYILRKRLFLHNE